jgi:hypothetical protein
MPALDVTTEEIGEAAARWAAEAGQVADAQAIIAALAERRVRLVWEYMA